MEKKIIICESQDSHSQQTPSSRPMNMSSVHLWLNSVSTQIGHLVVLKTSMLKEHKILKISVFGLLPRSIRLHSFHINFMIHETAVSIVHQPYVAQKISILGTGSYYFVDWVKCIAIPVII